MQIIFKIENDQELTKLGILLQKFQISSMQTELNDNIKQTKDFFAFSEKIANKIGKITIPDREERNAR